MLVHPRGYGEHDAWMLEQVLTDGSSPWVRGTQAGAKKPKREIRFIPVGTGNTALQGSNSKGFSVHPRGYGEHWLAAVSAMAPYGSSPWVRGTPVVNTERLAPRRFIPVGTGNTRHNLGTRQGRTVHPRGYGEHLRVSITSCLMAGSSPWVRGTHHVSRTKGQLTRFIPVGTGNTTAQLNFQQVITVHPRGYGEHYSIATAVLQTGGSSPWVRGTQGGSFAKSWFHRFIPVGTGNTCIVNIE